MLAVSGTKGRTWTGHLFALQIGVLVIVLLARPVPVVRLEPPAGGDVPVPAGTQVPLAHHVGGEVEAGVEVLGEEPELERQGVRLGRMDDPVLKSCEPVSRLGCQKMLHSHMLLLKPEHGITQP